MRVLITGGAGFIGSNLARLALQNDVQVTVIDDFSTGKESNLRGLDVRLVAGSILDDDDDVRSAFDDVDSVVHLAALPSVPRSIRDPLASHQANATGTLTVLEHARRTGVEHVIVASSSSVYGMNPAQPKSEREWVRAMSPYAASKLAAEQYALAYQQSFGIRSLVFRPFNVYGPGQSAGHEYAAVIPAFVDALLDQRELVIHGDGRQSRDFTYVGAVCRVLLDAARRNVSYPEPINLAFGTSTSLNELVDVLERVSGRNAAVHHVDSRPGDVVHSRADGTVLRSLFPTVERVPLEQGVRETLEWYEAIR